MLPPYAPPVYHSVENFQDYGMSSCIVPPPVFDPTDLPPPYSSQNPSLAESQYSLSSPESSSSQQITADRQTEVHFQPVQSSCQTVNHDQDPVAEAPPSTTCSTPSGVIHLGGGSPPWDTQSNPDVDSMELLSASGSSDVSSNSYDRNSSDGEHRQAYVIDSHGHKAVISRVIPFKVHHPTCSTSRIQAELPELARASTGSRKRTSSLGLIQETSPKDLVNARPVRTTSGSPVRGTTILSLRTRSRSLGENSIYVNSFEVMTRPPPNRRLPADEPHKPYSTDSYLNRRNAHQRLKKGTTHRGDTLIALQGSRRSEQRKERGKHRRRRHSHNILKHKGKRNVNCELVDSQVNCGHEASVSPGKETIV